MDILQREQTTTTSRASNDASREGATPAPPSSYQKGQGFHPESTQERRGERGKNDAFNKVYDARGASLSLTHKQA